MPSELSDSDAVHQVNHLLHLANDLCLAYKSAIRRLDDASMRESLHQMDHSHDRFRAELGEWVRAHGGHETGVGDFHGLVERIRVVVGDITGDIGILRAMATNEEELVSAYREARAKPGMPAELLSIIDEALVHEVEHRAFYDRVLSRFVG